MCYGLSFAMRNPNGFNMNKLEYFGKVIKVVTDLMDVGAEDIIGKSRVPEVVDARWLAICLMNEKGYSTRQIASLIGHPKRTVNNALSSFDYRAKRVNPHLSNMLAIARQQLL